jgi:hypothetical protein
MYKALGSVPSIAKKLNICDLGLISSGFLAAYNERFVIDTNHASCT